MIFDGFCIFHVVIIFQITVANVIRSGVRNYNFCFHTPSKTEKEYSYIINVDPPPKR